MAQKRDTGRPMRVVSGGQTGVDRGALDAAILLGISHGGWCPRGRLAEDGPIAAQYRLKETKSAKYAVRTRRNVEDSDGTLILLCERLHGGTELTVRLAEQLGKPHLLVNLHDRPDVERVRQWIRQYQIEVLNVAGPRESSSSGIAQCAQQFLELVLGGQPTG